MRRHCRGWQEAALAGDVGRLERLQTAGKFLSLSSPDRASAGEARKAEAWLAAVIACRAGHVGVLRWLFQAGWPPTVDAVLPFHLRDLAQSSESGLWGLLVDDPHAEHADVRQRGPKSLVERELYRAAVLQPTVGCLEALLGAGCRSPWIPFLACVEERMAHLEAALRGGCAWRLWDICELVGHLGSLAVLDALHRHLVDRKIRPPMHYQEYEWAPAFFRIPGDAARGGHAALLTRLFQLYPYLCNAQGDIGKWVCGKVLAEATENGHLECLRVLESNGWNYWATNGFSAKTTLPCFQFLMDRVPQHIAPDGWAPKMAATVGIEALQLFVRMGGILDSNATHIAARAGCPASLQYCLDRGAVPHETWWHVLMDDAILSGNVECMRIVCHSGYRARQDVFHKWLRPVERALEHASMGCVELAQFWLSTHVPNFLPSDLNIDMCEMARRGEGYLRAAHALGKQFHEMTAPAAAFAGQLQALQFAHEKGAVWDVRTLAAAVKGGSLECLKYAHAEKCGYDLSPKDHRFMMKHNSTSWALDERKGHVPDLDIQVPAPSLPVLKYVCQHLDAQFSAAVLKATALALSEDLRRHRGGRQGGANDISILYDWQLALYVRSMYTGRALGRLPRLLAQVVEWRRKRAAAFAGVCWKTDVPAMRNLPSEIVREIAVKAHLVLP